MFTKKTTLFLSLFLTTQFYSTSTLASYYADDLGSLATNNSGNSEASAVSGNGLVVVGKANNDSGSSQAFRYDLASNSMVSLGTLRADNFGSSEAMAVSSDGRIVVGVASTESYANQAFRYDADTSKMIGLGTLRTDNTGSSFARDVSADGIVVVGHATTNSNSTQAFLHNSNDPNNSGMIGLGTLKSDNSGNSWAYAVSADGKAVTGRAATDSGDTQAFRYDDGTTGMVGLGTLKSNNSGYSEGYAISANGNVIVGNAETDSGSLQAFLHKANDPNNSGMVGLGTLKSDNSGDSWAYAVSADGRVVVGLSASDTGSTQAFRYTDDSGIIGMGSLTSDGRGYSSATVVSADGKVVAGLAETNDGDLQAFRHDEGSANMIGLGTLRADGRGFSSATGISDDGVVIVGRADNNVGENRVVVWKTSSSDGSNGTGKAVDLENTIDSMIKSTDKAQQVLGVYEGQLFSLADRNCNLSADKDYCLGIYTNYNNVKDSDLYASGLIGAMRIANTGWTVGGAVNFNLSDNLVDGYKAHGFELPGVGAFVRYNENKDGTGFNSELKGSYLKQKMTITREALDGAEHGEGETKLSGYLVDLGFGYGIQSNKWLVTPKVNLRHHEITRDGYAENRNADFLASYEEMGNKNTNLALSINSKYALSPKVNLEAEVGSYMTLKNDQKDAVVKIDYIGEYSSKKSYEQADFRPFVKLSSSYAVTPNSSVGVNASWHKTTYKQDFTQAGLMYSYSW